MSYHAEHRAFLEAHAEQMARYQDPSEDMRDFYAHVSALAEERHRAMLPALDHVAQIGPGATLRHHGRSQWVTLFPDASEPGAFRWQLYDENGFVSHGTHATLFAATVDAAEQGFVIADDDAPRRIFALPSFECGNRIAAVIQACNAGRMSWAEAHAAADRIRAEYAPSALAA